jgi:hypothetical protein
VRIVGIILIVIGALALGYETYRVEHDKAAKQNAAAKPERTIWIPPVVGGIALVTGLLVTAIAVRPKDD